MTMAALQRQLDADGVAKVTRRGWARIAAGFEETEVHDTGVAGKLWVGTWKGKLVAVEEATPTHLAVRVLRNQRAARDFVAGRLAAYDRLWDG